MRTSCSQSAPSLAPRRPINGTSPVQSDPHRRSPGADRAHLSGARPAGRRRRNSAGTARISARHARNRGGAARAAAVRERIDAGLAAQPERAADLGLIRDMRRSLPSNAIVGIRHDDRRLHGELALRRHEPDTFLYPFGSATLGYAWPAAIGAKLACPDREVVAIHGDGGVLYSIVELLSAAQHAVAATSWSSTMAVTASSESFRQFGYERTFGVDLNGPGFCDAGDRDGRRGDRGRTRKPSPRHWIALATIDAPVMIHLEQALRLPNATE